MVTVNIQYMFRKIIILIAILCGFYNCFSQDAFTLQEGGANLNVIYRNESTFGLVAHSNGFGVNYRRGRHVTGNRKRVVEFEFVNIRHPKEVKVVNPSPNLESAKGFYYGKLNSLLVPRVGVGFQNVLYRKAERKSVEIRYSSFLGASLGLAKPVYLEIIHERFVNGDHIVEISTEQYDPLKYTLDDIYGRGPYFKGFDHLKIYPGGYAKFALSFEYADLRNDVKVIETGFTVDVYPKVVPLMATTQNHQIFVNVYVALIYGKKWF